MAGNVTVILKLTAQSGKADVLRPVLLELADKSRKEKGCLSYVLLQDNNDVNEFALIEEWNTEPALDAHLQTAHVAKAFAQGGPLLVAPPENHRYKIVR